MTKVVELFAGVGSQKKGIKNLGVDHEIVAISEWQINAIIVYDSIHTNDNIDYTKGLTKEEVLDMLSNFTFSMDGKTPYNIKKLKEPILRKLFNANKRTKNLASICDIKKLPCCDLLTYSFPCQDISVAGKQEGIKEGTRSGLLYEVERLLEISEKPKYLLLENVKNLVGKNHINDFNEWILKLNKLGYKSYWKVLNAKNYGLAQNRERVFMVSVLKDLNEFFFDEGEDNGVRLRDFLESEVDEKYYMDKPFKLLGDKKVCAEFTEINFEQGKRIHHIDYDFQTISAKDRGVNNILIDAEVENLNAQNRRVFSTSGICGTIDTMQGGHRQPKILNKKAIGKYSVDGFVVRKLTPLECWRLMGFEDEDFYKAKSTGASDSQLYMMAGNSICVPVLEAIFKGLKLD